VKRPDTSPIPFEDVSRAVAAYKRDSAMEAIPRPSRRRAERSLQRLERACHEVLVALDSLPDDLQTFYSGALAREAGEIASEAALRRHRLPKRPWGGKSRARLEHRIAELFVQHGGRLTTYDPRRYVEPQGGEGSRGGKLALLLQTVYRLAGIPAPSDLSPVLVRLRDEAKRAAERREKLSKYISR